MIGDGGRDEGLARRGIGGRVAAATVCALLLAALVLGLTTDATAAICGGSIPCQCGDTVGSDYAMTENLGPCPRLIGGADTVGLRIRPDVILDCQNHSITGPADLLKDSFGIRVGTSFGASNMTVKRCDVSGFWWGVYVESATHVLIDSNHLHDNGWKSATENGTGYGLDVANSTAVTVTNNRIIDNGNEGFHLSSSSGVIVEDNVFQDNGFEQLYLIRADNNVIGRNRATGGTQGLEMRFSSGNAFSYNVWAGSPLQYLENDNHNNTFLYERFEGRVAVGDFNTGNRFESSSFSNHAGNCMTVTIPSTAYVFKSFFGPCTWDVVGNALVTLDRSMNTLAKVSKAVKVKFPGCTADFDQDGSVTPSDRPTLLAAMGSVIGSVIDEPNWDPEADLNHDGAVDETDSAIFDAQEGPCAAELMVTALTDPPAVAVPGAPISVTDTIRNQSRFAAGSSRTQYYLSLDASKNTSDKLLGGRNVPALSPNGESTATVTMTIPNNTILGSYFLLACADDTGLVLESTETNNCRASTTKVQVGRPDLVMTDVGSPPAAVALGGGFPVTDTFRNQSAYPIGASRVQYYLSLDGIKGPTDKLLSGARVVTSLGAGLASSGGMNVVVPNNTPAGSYVLIACADDARQVVESNEDNNCRPAPGQVQVGKPDLVLSALSEPPPPATKVRGTSFSVTDTVSNLTPFKAGPLRVQYYLSGDQVKNAGDRLLTGFRAVAAGVVAGAPSTGTMSVTIPPGTVAGSYYLLACADDAGQVIESVETNNCRASVGRVTVTVGP